MDLDNDGKTDLTFSEIIVENPQTESIIFPTGDLKLPSRELTGSIISGTSFSVPKNTGKTGQSFFEIGKATKPESTSSAQTTFSTKIEKSNK